MPMTFFSIKESAPQDPEYPRTSSLQVQGDSLKVIGNLPHNYSFEPASIADAHKLAAFFKQWAEQHEET